MKSSAVRPEIINVTSITSRDWVKKFRFGSKVPTRTKMLVRPTLTNCLLVIDRPGEAKDALQTVLSFILFLSCAYGVAKSKLTIMRQES